jgi:hypothetical protein
MISMRANAFCFSYFALRGSSQTFLHCAHRTSTVLSCAFCEHKGWSGLFPLLLLNACLALQPPHILHDLIDICRSDGVDFRHVAELPMVRLDTDGCSSLKGLISVMVRLIDLMHQRRSMVSSRCVFPMTGQTVCVEAGFARLELGWHSAAHGCLCRLCGLCGVAGHEEAQA